MSRSAYEMENMNWEALFKDAENEPNIFVSLYLSRYYGVKRTEFVGLTKETLLGENEPYHTASQEYLDVSKDSVLYKHVMRLPEGYLFENKGDYIVARTIDDRLCSFLKKYDYPIFTYTDVRTLYLFEHLKAAGELRTVGAGYGDSSTFNEKNARILGISPEDYALYAKNAAPDKPKFLLHEELENLATYSEIISNMGYYREVSTIQLHEINEILKKFIHQNKNKKD